MSPVSKAPKTLRQLRAALADADAFDGLPFANDLEDEFEHGPVVCRLLFFAEMSACIEKTDIGTFSAPTDAAPQVYAAVQKRVFQKRRRPAARTDGRPPVRLESADDLAELLVKFASGGGEVLRALIGFALPPS